MATPELNRQRSAWPTLLALALITTLGGLVRWLIAADELLWLDELHTSWVVADGLGDVYQRATSGNQTPLFFWSTWFSVQVFGESEISLRLVSLFAGVVTTLAAGWLVFRWTGSTIAAAVTSILVAFDIHVPDLANPHFIYYATEARPYALVQFLSVVQVALFWQSIFGHSNLVSRTCDSTSDQRIDQRATLLRSRLFALSLTSALLFYAHFTSAWLLIAEACFVLVLLLVNTTFRRSSLKKVLTASTTTAVLCLPALFQLGQLLGRRSNWSSVSSARSLLIQQAVPVVCWVVAPLVALAVAFLIRPQAFLWADKDESRNQSWQLWVVLLWAILPTIGVVAMDVSKLAPMALVRYTMVGAVAMPVFAGLVIGFVGQRTIRTVLAISLLALSLLLSPVTSGQFTSSGFDVSELPRLRSEEWRTPVNEINSSQSKSNQPVFLASNLIEDVSAFDDSDEQFQEYLRFPIGGIYRIENQKRKQSEKDILNREIIAIPSLSFEHLRPSDIEKIEKSNGAWLIVRGTRGLAVEIEDEILKKFSARFPAAVQLQTTRFEVSSSHVYLISFDQ